MVWSSLVSTISFSDHAGEEGFEGAVAEAVDNLLDGAGGDAAGAVEAGVDEGAAVDGVLDVAFFFEPEEDRANGGVFERAAGGGEGLLDLGGGCFGALPDGVHDGAFEIGDGGAG